MSVLGLCIGIEQDIGHIEWDLHLVSLPACPRLPDTMGVCTSSFVAGQPVVLNDSAGN